MSGRSEARAEAARLALDLTQRDLAKVVVAGGPGFLAELDTLEESERQGILEAIDTLEAGYLRLESIRSARQWVLSGGKPTGGKSPAISLPVHGNEIHTELEAHRSVFSQPRKAPRPTTDPDGTPRTGWAALEKVASGERRIGQRRPPTASV